MAAIDFYTVEIWTRSDLTTFYLVFVMELKSRRFHFAGCTTSPHEAWIQNMARELTNSEGGVPTGKRYLIMARDTNFCQSFRAFLKNEGFKSVRLPPRTPNMNAQLERFSGSLKSECLNRLILPGEQATCNAVRQYLDHYNADRGVDTVHRPPDVADIAAGCVVAPERGTHDVPRFFLAPNGYARWIPCVGDVQGLPVSLGGLLQDRLAQFCFRENSFESSVLLLKLFELPGWIYFPFRTVQHVRN